MADLFAYIEFYNRNRRHSSLGFILQGLNRGQQTRGPLRLGGEKQREVQLYRSATTACAALLCFDVVQCSMTGSSMMIWEIG